MAEGTERAITPGEENVNYTGKRGVILMLERCLEDIVGRQDFLMSDYAHRTIDPWELKREHSKLHHRRLDVETKLRMAQEEAAKRKKKNWNLGSRTQYDIHFLDYVQFVDRGFEVVLFAVNHQGDRTAGVHVDMTRQTDPEDTIRKLIDIIQEDSRFHPIPAVIHILEAIVRMGDQEKNEKAWRMRSAAEWMLEEINTDRARMKDGADAS